jgi:hypothetical protein
MGQIYDETFIKKLGLTPAEIREQCTGAAFDGANFHLNSPDHLAKPHGPRFETWWSGFSVHGIPRIDWSSWPTTSAMASSALMWS